MSDQKEKSPFYDKLFLAPSTIHGTGVFTPELLPAGSWIGDFTGTLLVKDFVYSIPQKNTENGMIYYIEGTGKLRYVNHSATPNCVLKKGKLYTLRDIQPGEEITWYYNDHFQKIHHPKMAYRYFYRLKTYLGKWLKKVFLLFIA